jgi:spore coat polysaccharide biosynthesis protein SpsF
MRSRRFPGKVLAPLNGEPLLVHVLRQVTSVVSMEDVTLATSTDRSDDPLALYAASLGVSVFRGPLDDVFERFRGCLEAHPCAWFVRICADSPRLDSSLLRRMMAMVPGSGADLITNIEKRTFPKGQSVEIVRSAPFAALAADRLTLEDREHVTRLYYRHPNEFRIANVERAEGSLGTTSLAVDTCDDLMRLEGRPDGVR